MKQIGQIEISETEVFRFNEIEKYFSEKNHIIEVSKNGKIDFNIVSEHIDKANLKPNIYGILIRNSTKNSEWNLKYIGQRKSKEIKSRLKQHLIKHNEKTGAQLNNIENEMKNGSEIGVILFAIKPDELRQYYEQKLLNKFGGILWNKQK